MEEEDPTVARGVPLVRSLSPWRSPNERDARTTGRDGTGDAPARKRPPAPAVRRGMLPLLSVSLALVPLAAPRDGEIPHLAANEWIVVTESGGQLGHRARLTIRTDGTATVDSRQNRAPARTVRWRLTGAERRELRRLVDGTDFDALHRAPKAPYPPSAVDALDRGLAVRRGNAVRGWTNTVWTLPEAPVPLFVRLGELMARARA